MPSLTAPVTPQLPPDLVDIPVSADFAFDFDTLLDSLVDFLTSVCGSLHPQLDETIAEKDCARVLTGLATSRRQYSPSAHTLSTAIERAIECEQLAILEAS